MNINMKIGTFQGYYASRRYVPIAKRTCIENNMKRKATKDSFIKKFKNLFSKTDKTVKLVSDGQNNILKRDFGLNLHIKEGEILGIGENVSMNVNGKLKSLDLSPATFLKLFPQNKPLVAKQADKIGNCWFVSTLNALMSKPKGKFNIYNKFIEYGKYIAVKLNNRQFTYTSPQVITSDTQGMHLNGAMGFKMLEQAVGAARLSNQNGNMNHIADIEGVNYIMKATEFGHQKSCLKMFNSEFKPKHIKKSLVIKRLIKKHANKQDRVLGISTHNVFNSDFLPWHCYIIKGYDKKTKQVLIQDPRNPYELINYNIDKLLKNSISLTMCNLK